MGYKMKGWSGYQSSPAKQVDKHNIAAEKLNTTGQWCVTCGTAKSEHAGKDHAFKVASPPGPDTKSKFDFSKERDYGQKRDFHKKFDYSGEPDPSHEPRVREKDKK